jgi:hypothetical protein
LEKTVESRNATETVWHLVQMGVCDSEDVWTAIRQCVDADDLMYWVQTSLRDGQPKPLGVDWGCVLRRLVSWH